MQEPPMFLISFVFGILVCFFMLGISWFFLVEGGDVILPERLWRLYPWLSS